MSAARILWGPVLIVFAIVIASTWTATQWTAWRLGFQPELGQPWFELGHGVPVYLPPAFFWWWYSYDAYAPSIFVEGAYISVSGALVSIVVAIGMSIWRAREAKNIVTYGSARWASDAEISAEGLLGPDGVVLGRYQHAYLRHDGPEHVLCFAPTRSGCFGPPSRHGIISWSRAARRPARRHLTDIELGAEIGAIFVGN